MTTTVYPHRETRTIIFSDNLPAGRTATIFDVTGPVTTSSINLSVAPYGPVSVRAQRLLVYSDDLTEPAMDVPIADLAGFTHGRVSPMRSRYAESSGSTVTLMWPISAREHLRMNVVNEFSAPVPFGASIDYRRVCETPYLAAAFTVSKPPFGQPVEISLPKGARELVGLVVGVQPSDNTSWCGEGRIMLDDQVLADGLDMLAGTSLDVTQWFGSDRGASVAVRMEGSGSGHDLLGIYRWFPHGVVVEEPGRLMIEQLGRIVRVHDGTYTSARAPRSDRWEIVTITTHDAPANVERFEYSAAEAEKLVARRDYEELTAREHLWGRMQQHRAQEPQ
ncbi:DUF2961 domain-containing protein [Actinomyces sp. oral taxon 448]|uniref:DUF2961 domain-containing protein n=1 Tax=Actinomyces sp. oral taxon 448 TaxID=712124 RepID=UPI001CAE86FD|nr:DUF2961 domain-containing protein [Actinomyces sp. oral taxon 448]MBF0969174.1 DUF2961 domain-containing protein [Actinomyces sp.]